MFVVVEKFCENWLVIDSLEVSEKYTVTAFSVLLTAPSYLLKFRHSLSLSLSPYLPLSLSLSLSWFT